jgi:hypothetical protein
LTARHRYRSSLNRIESRRTSQQYHIHPRDKEE